MSDDFEKKAAQRWSNRGVEFNADTARKEFVLSGPDRRAAALDDLDAAINESEVSEGTGSWRTAAERVTLRRDLRALHHKMLSVKPIADTPLIKFDKPLVVRIRDKATTKGRRQANYVKTVLSLLFAWGCERGFLATNPAAGIKSIRRKKGLPDANRPWADEERDAALTCPAHMRAAIALMMFTGLGPKDALTLPRSYLKGNEIATRRSKTGEPIFWPCPAQLTAIFAEAPAHDAITLCANSRGKPWTLSGFNSSWQKFRRRLEREGRIGPGLTLYGMRHTVAVILREIGFDERTIADALGQQTIEMARHYAKGADLKPKMRGVVTQFDAELNKRKTKTVKPGS